MSGLSQRIQDLETQIVAKRDALQVHVDKMDDTNVSNSDLEIMGKFNQDIAQLTRTREGLIESEKALGQQVAAQQQLPRSKSLIPSNGDVASPSVITDRRKDKEVDLVDLFVRAGTLAYFSRGWGRSIEETRLKIGERYPQYRDDDTKITADIVIIFIGYNHDVG